MIPSPSHLYLFPYLPDGLRMGVSLGRRDMSIDDVDDEYRWLSWEGGWVPCIRLCAESFS